MGEAKHKPVLLDEAIEYLNLNSGDNAIDCTFGGGGHSRAILKKIQPTGRLLAIDADKSVALAKGWETLNPSQAAIFKNKNFKLIIGNFRQLKKIVEKNFNYPVKGILLDLGLSSDQLEDSGRGFSFQRDEPLDMRFDASQNLTAAGILNNYSLENLYDIFKNFGEYPHARRLSKIIIKQRKIKKFRTTFDLVEVVRRLPVGRRHRRIHPATQVFQALRIAVNNELENLRKVLPQAVEILQPRGRLVVISFQSLEDRIVKNYFRDEARREGSVIKLLTKKPVVPKMEEVKNNPRSRSAKMRAIEKQGGLKH